MREGRRLTVVGVVEVDDFLPAIIPHRVDDSAMIIRTHAYGEIQETGGRCQNLKQRGHTRVLMRFRLSDCIRPLGGKGVEGERERSRKLRERSANWLSGVVLPGDRKRHQCKYLRLGANVRPFRSFSRTRFRELLFLPSEVAI